MLIVKLELGKGFVDKKFKEIFKLLQDRRWKERLKVNFHTLTIFPLYFSLFAPTKNLFVDPLGLVGAPA